MSTLQKPVRVLVEYLDGEGEDVQVWVTLAGIPRRNDLLLLRWPGVHLRVREVEWRSAKGDAAPEVALCARLCGSDAGHPPDTFLG